MYPQDSKLIADLVDKLVRVTDASQVILFGDYARNQVVSNSTLDLLVIVNKPFDEKRSRWETVKLYQPIVKSYPFRTNLIIYSADQIKKLRAFPNHLATRVMEEGTVLYQRRAAAKST